MGKYFYYGEGRYTPSAILKEKTITENGTYEPLQDGADGYDSVTVNVEGGGGSWQTVFEGSVTTEESGGASRGSFQGNISEETIKVTFNGTEYTCNRTGEHPEDMYRYGATYSHDEYNFTDYPFCIEEGMATGTWTLITETAGTYTLKIEEEQSGSSDFSTAEVTIINNGSDLDVTMPIVLSMMGEESAAGNANVLGEETSVFTVILYKGVAMTNIEDMATVTESTGNYDDGIITGDCTITIS